MPQPSLPARALASFSNRSSVPVSRRQALAGMGALAGAALLSPRGLLDQPASEASPWVKQPLHARVGTAPRHLVWVWQFRHDGHPLEVRDRLAAHGLGVVLKTHDGSEWMSRYDRTEFSVSGPQSVADWAQFFEEGGVPFHAWALVKGRRAEVEAQMASDVLSAGARSLFLDLEAHPGFWEGTDVSAGIYGEQLRRMQPNARLSTSIDPRPWEIDRIPLQIFADFTDEISPQAYWGFFNNEANARRYRAAGSSIPSSGIGPDFVVSTMMERLREFGRPVHPIGDGTAREGWAEFIDASYSHAGADSVSLWRYGVATDQMLATLRDTPPRVASYTVQPGDTLAAIAARTGSTVGALVQANGLANANHINVGQVLLIPGGSSVPQGITNPGGAPVPAPAAPAPPARTFPPPPSWMQQPAPTASSAPAGTSYVVRPGDSLLGIASRHGRSVDQIARANGISNPNHIRIGQRLTIP